MSDDIFLGKKKKKTDGGSGNWPDDEKLGLQIDIVQLISDVSDSLAKISSAVQNCKDHKYGPALAAILSVIQNLFDHEVAPHIGKQ